jgi:hypothetical protein
VVVLEHDAARDEARRGLIRERALARGGPSEIGERDRHQMIIVRR